MNNRNHMAVRHNLTNQLQEHMALFGYEVVETPIIDHADLFLTKAGDQIIERLFTFERYGRNLALRPEFTAGAANLYQRQSPSIKRWQFNGPIFEDNLETGSNSHQRDSLGAELINLADETADAEIIAMATQGIPHDNWHLHIGNVGLTRQLLKQFQLDPRTEHFLLQHRHNNKKDLQERLSQYLPKSNNMNGQTSSEFDEYQMVASILDKGSRGGTMAGRTQQDIARRLQQKQQQASQQQSINEALDFLIEWRQISGPPDKTLDAIGEFIKNETADLDSWRKIIDLLENYDITQDRIILQPDLTHSWDYYTGIVFEVRGKNAIKLASGGRYDELIGLVGGKGHIPAVGFAYYLNALLDTVDPVPMTAQSVIDLDYRNNPSAAIKWAQHLRQNGLAVALQPPTHSHPVNILASGQVLYQSKIYTLDQLDVLVSTINESQLNDT